MDLHRRRLLNSAMNRGVRSAALACAGALLAACGVEPVADFKRHLSPHRANGSDDTVTIPDATDAMSAVELDGRPAWVGPYPIVLVHGFSGFSAIGGAGYFYGVQEDLSAAGDVVYTPSLPPVATSSARARVLKDLLLTVLRDTGAPKVHLIAHSQGGLDLRALTNIDDDDGSAAFPAEHIASITTISTPHQGTAVADLAALAPDGALNPAGQLLAWLITGLNQPPSDLSGDAVPSDAWSPELDAALTLLTPAGASAFSLAHPWPADVPVFSIAGVTNLQSLDHAQCHGSVWQALDGVDITDPALLASGALLALADGGTVLSPSPNDGLVSVHSARDGIFLGCVAADHADEIGQFGDNGAIGSGFDHLQMNRDLVAHLRTLE